MWNSGYNNARWTLSDEEIHMSFWAIEVKRSYESSKNFITICQHTLLKGRMMNQYRHNRLDNTRHNLHTVSSQYSKTVDLKQREIINYIN